MGDTIVVRPQDDYVAPALRGSHWALRRQVRTGARLLRHHISCSRRPALGSDVAIKEYLPTALAVRHDGVTVVPNSTKVAEEFAFGRERFIDEGHTLAGFRGRPGMVHVYDLVEDNGTAYIVMELVHGSTLDKKLERTARFPHKTWTARCLLCWTCWPRCTRRVSCIAISSPRTSCWTGRDARS